MDGCFGGETAVHGLTLVSLRGLITVDFCNEYGAQNRD